MKKLLPILLCLPMIGFGQGWVKNYYDVSQDFTYVSNVISTYDSGFAIINYNGIIKTNSFGDTVWTKQNFFGTEFGIQTIDGGYTLVGSYGIYKLDNLGILLWQNSNMFLEPQFIDQTSDGGYVYTGQGPFNLRADERIRVVKTKDNGDTIWVCQPYLYDSCSVLDIEGGGMEIHETHDNNFILGGYRYILNSGVSSYNNALLSKINNIGDTVWTKVYQYGDESKIFSILEKSNSNFVFVGYSRNWFLYNYCQDLLLVETDNQGNELWVKVFPSNCYAEALSVEEAHNGGYIICGTREINNGEEKIWVMRTDNFGDTLWTKSFGNPYGSGIFARKTLDDGYIILGEAYQNSFSFSIILIKIDGNGNFVSQTDIPVSFSRKLLKTVDILGKESKPKKNIPFLNIYDDGTIERKIMLD